VTHNRPKQAMEAIESILAQTDKNFRLVVSDNSSSYELRNLVGSSIGFEYIKRAQVLSGIDHGNQCVSEIKTDYFTLFNDDDLMLPNFVRDFWTAQSLFPEAVAFGANAIVENHGNVSGLSFKAARPYIGPISPNDLLRRYFSHHQLGIAPLPSYVYKKSALNGLYFDVCGGKYADVQWLSQWCAKGCVMWIAEPMMMYRLHDSNDGKFESRHDRFRFLAYLKSSGDIFSPEILSDYRFFLYKKLLPGLKQVGSIKAYGLLSKFLTIHRYRRLFRQSFYQALVNKTLTKLCSNLNKKS
jgi:glycosyltransferase involved in cell wall biosynthesis